MEPNVDQVNVKKKGKKLWILGPIVAIIVLALWGVSMANEIMAKIAPDKYFLLSLLETQKMTQQDTKVAQKSQLKNKKSSVDLNLKEIKGMYDDYYSDIFQGLGVSVSLANNEEGTIRIDTGLKKSGTSLMDLSIYSFNDQLGVKIPGVLDQYVMVDLNKFKEQYDQSNLYYYMGNIEQEEVTFVQDYIKQLRKALTGQATDTYASLNEDYKETFMEIAKDIDIKYTGTTKVSINNKSIKATKFAILIDSSDMKSLVKGIVKTTLRNKDFKGNIETLLNMDGGYYTIEEWEADVYDALDQLKFSDVEINCVVDNKKRIVNTELSTTMTADGDKAKVSLDYTLSGADDLLDQIEANARFQTEYDKIQLSFERNKSALSKKTRTAEEMIFKVKSDNEQIMKASYNLEQDLQAKTDNYDLTASLSTDDYTNFNLKLSGDLVVNKDHTEMSLDANKIALSVESYGDAFNLRGSGYFGVQDLKGDDINISDQQKLDLFSMDENQIFDIISRIGTQFYQIEDIIDSI